MLERMDLLANETDLIKYYLASHLDKISFENSVDGKQNVALFQYVYDGVRVDLRCVFETASDFRFKDGKLVVSSCEKSVEEGVLFELGEVLKKKEFYLPKKIWQESST